MRYGFYPDVFWVTNFVMDGLVLILVRRVKKSRSSLWRIVLAAAVGAAGTVIFFLSVHRMVYYQLLVHFLLNPIMIFLAFPVRNREKFFRDLATAYVMFLLLGGILSWAVSFFFQEKHFWIWAVGGFGICMLLLHGLESRKGEQLEFEVLLLTREQRLSLLGFLDTGNLLKDPLVRKPVHIIEEEVLEEVLAGEQPAIRYIPFHSLGQEQGVLPVVTLKAMYVTPVGLGKEVPPLYLEGPVFGLAKEKLFQGKKYQVILNAACIAESGG